MNKRVLVIAAGLLAVAVQATAQSSLLKALETARPHYGTPMSPAEQAALLNEVAWDHRAEGWGLLAKPTGNNCPTPAGVRVSCDYLVFAPTGQGFDVLEDSEGAGAPRWKKGDSFDRGRWVAPVAPAGGPQEPPPVDPPPVGGSTVLERVTELQARIERVLEQLAAQDKKLDAQASLLNAIHGDTWEANAALQEFARRPIPFPTYTATLFGQKITLTPKQP